MGPTQLSNPQKNAKKQVTFILVLFFVSLFSQPFLGNREDWPFTYFGMYKGLVTSKNFYRINISFGNEEVGFKDAFNYGVNGFRCRRVLSKLITGFTLSKNNTLIKEASKVSLLETSNAEVMSFIVNYILKPLESRGAISRDYRVRIVHVFWKNLTPKNLRNPSSKTVVFDEKISFIKNFQKMSHF